MLALELCDEVVHHAVVEVFSTQVSVSSSRLNLKDAILNGEDRHIESATTKIEDEDIPLSTNLKNRGKRKIHK